MRLRLAMFGLVFAAVILALSSGAGAQGLGLGQDSDQPIEINADQGIEWRRDEQIYVARGNASAKRGGITVHADTLTAHYRPVEGGGTDIYRLDAVGGVVITSPSSKATGDNGVYDVDNAILVLKGRALKMVSQDTTVTARDSLEYWDGKQMAVARGEALMVQQDKRLSADIVTSYFTEAAPPEAAGKPAAKPGKGGAAKTGAGEGANQIRRMEAFGNVHVSTPGQIAVGNKGVYDVESGIATLFGSVKITRDDNQLNGEYGEVNLNTGISRMLSGPPGATGAQPVRGLFSPKKKPEIAPRGQSGPAGAPGAAPAPPAAAGYVPTQAPAPVP